jgi:nucleolar pre-ribosomal-associated protein 1
MGKRTVFEADAKGARSDRDSKRQRVENGHERNSPRPNGTAEDVTHSRDLQKALLFDQSATPDFRNGKCSRVSATLL